MHEITPEELGIDDDFFQMTDKEVFDALQRLRYIPKDAIYDGPLADDDTDEKKKQIN